MMITDAMRREAGGLALRLPTWADAKLRVALREIAFTPFIRSTDEDQWRALMTAARGYIEAAEDDDEDEDEDARESRKARMIHHWRTR